MQIIIQTPTTVSVSGSSTPIIEPEINLQLLTITLTAISVGLFGNIRFVVQHSPDGSNWYDIPNAATGNLSTGGGISILLTPSVALFDHMRLMWTCTNVDSATFSASVTGWR